MDCPPYPNRKHVQSAVYLVLYCGAYPIVLDIPVDKEWHDYWNGIDRKMRYVGNTVKEVVALEIDIVCTILLDAIMHEAGEDSDAVETESHEKIEAPTLIIPVLNELFVHLVTDKELAVYGMELLMSMQSQMAIYSETGHRYLSKKDRVMQLRGMLENYKKCLARKTNIDSLAKSKKGL